jgi:hypothetical protein
VIRFGSYQYLRPKSGSNYEQLFCGRIRAEVLYRETVGPEPLTPEEVAEQYSVPVEAVQEAIDYCRDNQRLLDAERAASNSESSRRAATSGRTRRRMLGQTNETLSG